MLTPNHFSNLNNKHYSKKSITTPVWGLAFFLTAAGSGGSAGPVRSARWRPWYQPITWTHTYKTHRNTSPRSDRKLRPAYTDHMFDHNTTAATLRTHSLTARHTQYVSTRHPITVQKRTVLLWFVHWKHDRGTVGAGAATPTRETCLFLIQISPFKWLWT